MNRLKALLPLIGAYRWNLMSNALLNALGAVLSLFSFLSVVPFLRILFKGDLTSVDQTKSDIPGVIGAWFDSYVAEVGAAQALLVICLAVVVLAVLKNVTTYLAMYSLATIRTGVSKDLRNKTYSKLLSKKMSWFTDSKKGDVLSRLTVDLHEVEVSVVGSIEVMFKSPLMIIISFGALLALSWELTLCAMLFLPVSGVIISRVAKKLKKSALSGKEKLGSLSNLLEETLTGIKVIKAFSATNTFEQRYADRNQEHFKAMRKMFQREYMSSPISEIISLTTMAILLGYGGQIVLSGDTGLSGDWFIGYLVVFSQIIPPARALSDGWFKVSKGAASLDRIEDLFEDNIDASLEDGSKKLDKPIEAIDFKNIKFSYGDVDVLNDVSFSVKKGQVVALVGSSGSGKTTLSNLLIRLADPSSGDIFVNGINLCELDLHTWRSSLGVVTQEATLFNDSIYNNICLTDSTPDDSRIKKSAETAQVLDFASDLPNGLLTEVGDGGGRLSGGQRQRVALARAIYRDPEVIILDEATSALDAQSEAAVQTALDATLQGRTVLVIAHRLSTVKHADKIIVLEKGEIVESGTHEELIQLQGQYRKLVTLQSFSS